MTIKSTKRSVLFCFVFLLAICFSSRAQHYTLPNEMVIFSFKTTTGKTMTVSKEKADAYIVYRYGNAKKIEFTFPAENKNSWKQFKYSFYSRGGGVGNEGMELNYLYFTSKGFQYVIFDTYYAVGNKHKTGIKITNPASGKVSTIRANPKTVVGILGGLRANDFIVQGDELFD